MKDELFFLICDWKWLLEPSKSLLRLFAEVWESYITENKDVSSAKSFTLNGRPSVRSLM